MHESLLQRYPSAAEEITNIFGNFIQNMQEDREAAVFSGVDCSDVVDMIRLQRGIRLTCRSDSEAGAGRLELGVFVQLAAHFARDSARFARGEKHVEADRSHDQLGGNNELLSRPRIRNGRRTERADQPARHSEREVRIKEDMEDHYKQQIRELQQQIKQPLMAQTSSEYINKLVGDIISQISNDMDLRFMRDDPVYSKYFAMFESGVSLDDVAMVCRQEGNDEQVVRGPAIVLSYKDDILQRLQSKGVIPAVIPASAQGAAGAGGAAAAPQPQNDPNNPRNNPAYAKWFKLLDMHIPKEHLIIKMEQEGVDPSILDYETPGGAQPSRSEEPAADPWRPAASTAASKPKPKAVPIITEKKAELRRRQLHIVPENRMKNLYWDCIDNSAIEGSVWEKMHATVEKEIDYRELETLFAAKENTFLLSQSKQEAAKSTEQEERVQLIRDEKRLRNVGMAIVRLKPKIEDIRNAIIEVDDTILDDEMVRILVSNAPTQEEIEIVKGYEGDLSVLDEVDRFFKVLSTIPFLNERLACIKTYHQFSSTIEDLRNQIDRFKVAIEKCVRSENLTHLMELILAIGNFLNGRQNRIMTYG